MARAWKCDRCSSLFDKKTCKIPKDNTKIIAMVAFQDENYHDLKRYEFCDDCMSELLRWNNLGRGEIV